MGTFWWILVGGLLMSAIALVGSATLLLKESTLQRVVMPLVAFAAGSLLGGAFFHMLPAALEAQPDASSVFLWALVGFSVFFALEQFLHWHHCHRASSDCRKPLTYLILLGDGLHNFLGGLVAHAASARVEIGFLVPFAAGNFIHIGASDLVPEVNKHRELRANFVHFAAFAAGIALLWAIRLGLQP